MNFATAAYGLFLLIVVVVYWLLPRTAGRWWLILASFVFYASWNALYVPGFVALILVNWWLGRAAVARPRLAVAGVLLVNLGLLAYFKYAAWVVGSAASILGWVTGQPQPDSLLTIILPLAISFVTFTMLSYVIDIARGHLRPARLDHFVLFVTFFPHLIAGPIMRGRELLPQIRHPRPFAAEHLRLGVPWIIGGLAKKTIGDNLAPTVFAVFEDPAAFSTFSVWVGIVGFALQIYFDFSGYTDMARGSAALMGYRLPRNFDWPVRATSIVEIWHRWHITLSRWLRDYLYKPLVGGSRRGVRVYAALMVTWILGGLWHGAGATYLVWGVWLGAGITVHWWYRLRRRNRPGLPVPVAWVITWLFVLVGLVLFRAPTLESAAATLRSAFTIHGGAEVPAVIAIACTVLVILQWSGWGRVTDLFAPVGSVRRYASYGFAMVAIVLGVPVRVIEFVYFQF